MFDNMQQQHVSKIFEMQWDGNQDAMHGASTQLAEETHSC